MRRLAAMVCASLILVSLLVPMASGVSAAAASYAGFACDTHGTTAGGPTTTLSSVRFDTTGGSPTLNCLFRGTRLPASSGGTCTFDNVLYHVDFARRTLLPVNNNTNLLCSGGTVTIKTPTLSTIVHYGGDGGPAIFDTITYADGGTFSCVGQAEDGVTSCDHTYTPGTVVTVSLADDAQFLYICPGDPFMYQSTSGPYTGSCTVTMNGDQQVFVVGNEQL